MTLFLYGYLRKPLFEYYSKLLGGGVESMAITEAFGEFRTGKTQLSHTICVTAQIPTGSYSGGKVIFLDTENTLYPLKTSIFEHIES